LTESGIRQAQIANAYWQKQISSEHIPYPQSYYTSPLTRCLRTANITFSDLELPHYYTFVPTVKEFFREGISTHTCDHRSNKTYIQNLFPSFNIEPGFTEYDELWTGVVAEPSGAQDARSKLALDEVFASDDHTWVSITSHSGEIGSLLRVLGHRTFSLGTGAVIPVLVKAQFLPEADRPSTSVPAFTSTYFCTNGPPITSISTSSPGCVCSGGATVNGTGIASATAVPTAY
jgi:broad specificity phosphatase PhoE